MKTKLLLQVIVLSVLFVSSSALADTVSGTFTAVSACDAYKSFNKATNPGLIKTTPGTEYEAVEINNKDADWVRIRVPGITDELRWVSSQCGTKRFAPPEVAAQAERKAGKNCNIANTYDSNVLALTWQPGFCKHFSYNGVKPECDAIKNGSLAVSHLTIHGLWPNKNGCGNYFDCGTADLDLADDTVKQLGPWMPNFLYEQTFGRYEWKKHGTCQERSDDDYFLTEVALAQAVDNSVVGSFIRSKAGGKMSVKEFFDQVRNAYGQDVADRIKLLCAEKDYLQEIRLNLPRTITVDPDLGKMMQGANRMDGRVDRCRSDLVVIESSGEGSNPNPCPPPDSGSVPPPPRR